MGGIQNIIILFVSSWEFSITRDAVSEAQHIQDLIYIVDDESLLAELAEAVLSQEGYRSAVFVDPSQALLSFTARAEKPRLLVTDCVMNGMDGLELIRKCREQSPALKTILLSGTVTEDFVYNQAVIPDRFIPKPYNVQALIDAVNDLMGAPEARP